MASSPAPSLDDLDPYLVRKYITACHILHFHDLVDAYGHISVRLSPSTFLMSRYLAPALVASRDDLVIYSIDDAEPLIPNPPRGFSERFIHSEVYKAYPSITSVVHSHAVPIIPFSISSQPLAACFHMAGFLGTRVPVWDFDAVYAPSDQHDMLVRDATLGASLARSLRGDITPSAGRARKLNADAKADADGSAEAGVAEKDNDGDDAPHTPPNVVALMRGHGMVVVAQSIEMCVLRAVYTVQNARILLSARTLGGDVKLFTDKEVTDTRDTTAKGAVKPWPLWVREVESAGGIYRNLA